MYIKNNLIAKYLQACMVCLKEERTPFTVIEVVIHMNNNNIYKFIVFFFLFDKKRENSLKLETGIQPECLQSNIS